MTNPPSCYQPLCKDCKYRATCLHGQIDSPLNYITWKFTTQLDNAENGEGMSLDDFRRRNK